MTAPAAYQDPGGDFTVQILPGYRPGILARCLESHMVYYSKTDGWGAAAEAVLAIGLGDLVKRLSHPVNEVWAAVETRKDAAQGDAGRIVGTIWVDGENLGEAGVAHIRAFIVDEHMRGLGLGRKLLDEAMTFVHKVGFREVMLRTMRSLSRARKLYEAAGFVQIGETYSERFGSPACVLEYRWQQPPV
ncbi:hypothetical protein VTK73DRAFT_5729 [Phialemonium thermophilum]|uniref:N-acetyltransferase domain-containing protein n=1 Tax=Phialemonium thermophilum TaxID=223376 RepID=A0ABR3XXR7_9PEZI